VQIEKRDLRAARPSGRLGGRLRNLAVAVSRSGAEPATLHAAARQTAAFLPAAFQPTIFHPSARGPPIADYPPIRDHRGGPHPGPTPSWADGAPRHQPRSTRFPPRLNRTGVMAVTHSTSMHSRIKRSAQARNRRISGEPAAIPVGGNCGVRR